MNRRALGRGRTLIGLGAILMVGGLIPRWWIIARTDLEPLSGTGLEGSGLVIFLAAMAMLAVMTLPYASRHGDSPLDRASTYVLLGLAALGAFLFRAYEINQMAGIGLPTAAPGLWITAVGLGLTAWGVADVLTTPTD
jgi:hypothetical protein